jgi:hypothetical protein
MGLRVGCRLRSTVCAGEVVVVRSHAEDLVVNCGGYPMIEGNSGQEADGDKLRPRDGQDGGLILGKRYRLPGSDLELLCVRAGAGSLSVDGVTLEVTAAKPLPSSD